MAIKLGNIANKLVAYNSEGTPLEIGGDGLGGAHKWWAVAQDWHAAHEFTDMDINGGNYGIPGSSQKARDSFQEIGLYKPSLGVMNGDFVNPDAIHVNPQQYKVLRRYQALSGCPWIHSIGNHEVKAIGQGVVFPQDNSHDVTTGGTQVTPEWQASVVRYFYENIDDEYMENRHELNNKALLAYYDSLTFPATGYADWRYRTPDPVEDTAEKGFFSMYHDPTGVHHVVVNMCFFNTYGWDWSTEQKDWFVALMANFTAADRIVIYSHIPVKNCKTTARDDFFTAASSSPGKVLAVFGGHIHSSHHEVYMGINYLILRDSALPKHSSQVRGEYGTDQVRRASFALVRWVEETSKLHIQGFHDEASRILSVA